ncbi:MAG: cytochrome c oxidase subunit I [Thiomicrorhabdus sp.]|nr:MAG: cytochrome c oxidase subunit I [Thiomicrorhabdus sp.]
MKNNQQSLKTILATLLAVIILVLFISTLSEVLRAKAVLQQSSIVVEKVLIDPISNPQKHAAQAKVLEVTARFEQAVVMLHAQQFDNAIKALHRVLELTPRMPEAHVNMGFAFLGGGDAKAARDFFMSAIELNSDQLNAYYGLAVSAEKLGDMEMALGAMRTYVHLSPKDNRYLARARSALWEWQEKRGSKTKLYQ